MCAHQARCVCLRVPNPTPSTAPYPPHAVQIPMLWELFMKQLESTVAASGAGSSLASAAALLRGGKRTAAKPNLLAAELAASTAGAATSIVYSVWVTTKLHSMVCRQLVLREHNAPALRKSTERLGAQVNHLVVAPMHRSWFVHV